MHNVLKICHYQAKRLHKNYPLLNYLDPFAHGKITHMSIDKRRAKMPTWLTRITRDSQAKIADKTKLSQSSLSRQLSDDTPLAADTVITIARAYSKDPIRALREAGKLTTDEVAAVTIEAPLEKFTDRQLLNELMRRRPADEP